MSIVSPQVAVNAAVHKAFATGHFVEMSLEAGDVLQNQVSTKDGFDVSPRPATYPDALQTQRTAYIINNELYTNTLVSGGLANVTTNLWEDLGKAPTFPTI